MTKYWTDTASLLLQSQRVVVLRCAKIALGGQDARDEVYQMVGEKVKASTDATRMMMTGGSRDMVMAHYLDLVSNNVKRLTTAA